MIFKTDIQIINFFVGAILSLIFTYFPKIKIKFNALESKHKRVLLGLLVLLSAILVEFLQCSGQQFNLCSEITLEGVLNSIVDIFIANQVTYLFSPKVINNE